MRLIVIVFALVFATTAAAQQPYAAPDRELWDAMTKAFADLPMALATHQQVQQIMSNVQREAQARAARVVQQSKEPDK